MYFLQKLLKNSNVDVSLWSIKAMASYNVRLVCGTVQKFHFSSSYCVRIPLIQRTQAVAQLGQTLFEIAIVPVFAYMWFHEIKSSIFQSIADCYPFHIRRPRGEGRKEDGTPSKLFCFLILFIWSFSNRISKIIHMQCQKMFCHLVNCVE